MLMGGIRKADICRSLVSRKARQDIGYSRAIHRRERPPAWMAWNCRYSARYYGGVIMTDPTRRVPWPDADWILLTIGTTQDGVMADNLTPDTLRTCEQMAHEGFLAHTETLQTVRVYHTTALGVSIMGRVSH